MIEVTVTRRYRETVMLGGAPVDATLLVVADPPESALSGTAHTIQVDDLALEHRRAIYGLAGDRLLAAIVKEHMQRLCALPEHPSHPWGGLRPDVRVRGLAPD